MTFRVRDDPPLLPTTSLGLKADQQDRAYINPSISLQNAIVFFLERGLLTIFLKLGNFIFVVAII